MSKTYTYPDPNDKITATLIGQFQHNDDYWARSEQAVFRNIHHTISQINLTNYSLLDVGCGEGRLFVDFVNGASKIVGLEPDAERFAVAQKYVNDHNFNDKILLLNSSLENSHLHDEFDIVLSSHIIQHIPTWSLRSHIEQLCRHTRDNGLLIINTNISHEEDEYFVKDTLEGDQFAETKITKEEFDQLTHNGAGSLPIHMFNGEKLKEEVEAYGFQLLSKRLFHVDKEMQEQYGDKADAVVNNDPALAAKYGRDVCFIFQKQRLIKTIRKGALAEFCAFNININGQSDKLKTLLNGLRSSVTDIFVTSPFCTTMDSDNTQTCVCGDVADEFCKTGQRINSSFRYPIGTTYFNFFGKKIIPLKVSITFFPFRNVGIVCFNVIINDLPIDEVIVLKQFFNGCANLESTGQTTTELARYFQPSDTNAAAEKIAGKPFWDLCNYLIRCITNQAKAQIAKDFSWHTQGKYLIEENDSLETVIDNFDQLHTSRGFIYPTLEIKETDLEFNKQDAFTWSLHNCRSLYGLLVGDEGYKYVPRSLAQKRLSQYQWGTRKFVSIFAYGNNTILLNFKSSSKIGKEYIEYERMWSKNYYSADRNKYFEMCPCIAGIDHGLYRIIERNIVIFYENNYITQVDQSTAININKKRNKIILFLQKTESSKDEINDLFYIISQASGTGNIIDATKQRLALRSEEKNLINQRQNNITIFILTVTSTLLGFIAISQGSYFFDFIDGWIEKDPGTLLIRAMMIIFTAFGLFIVISSCKVRNAKRAWYRLLHSKPCLYIASCYRKLVDKK